MDQLLKIVRMKEDALTGKTIKDKAKEIVGSCRSMGVTIEGKSSDDMIGAINTGEFDSKFWSFHENIDFQGAKNFWAFFIFL